MRQLVRCATLGEALREAMNGIFLSVQEAVSQTARVAAQARALSDLAARMRRTNRSE